MPAMSDEALSKARELVAEYGFSEKAFEKMVEKVSEKIG